MQRIWIADFCQRQNAQFGFDIAKEKAADGGLSIALTEIGLLCFRPPIYPFEDRVRVALTFFDPLLLMSFEARNPLPNRGGLISSGRGPIVRRARGNRLRFVSALYA